MLVATAAPASAHHPEVGASCQTGELRIELYSYPDATVTVILDDKQMVQDHRFSGDYRKAFGLDPAAPHGWEVRIDAHDDNGYDRRFSGELEACRPAPDNGLEVGLYLYEKDHADEPASWGNSGDQELIAHREGNQLWTEFPGDLPAEVCGPGWAVQQDVVAPDGDFVWPTEIKRQVLTLQKWLRGAVHQNLSDLVDVPACDQPGGPVKLPAPVPVDVCGPGDAVTLPTSELATYAEEWNDQRTHVVVTATPNQGVALVDGAATTWQFDFDSSQCETTLPVVRPVLPTVADLCGVDNDRLDLPADGGNITYRSTDEGVVATAAAGYTLGTLPEGYTSTGVTTALYAVTDSTFTDADCELIASDDIGAVCVGDTPYLDYGVALPEGVEVDSDTPLTITFLHPDGGDNYVATDQPLEGQLLWPGASDTAPKQWPGWEQQDDGSYVETDGNYAWTRDGVEVLFEVNPEYSQIVSYPEASSECANPVGTGGADVEVVADDADVPPVEAEAADELPQTGATVGVFAGIAALLIVGGGVLFWLRRRIQH
ncbi:LPXTG cell wall anchor domain-containing protein [Isoptericola sp. NPDC019482]|uniref:LPXTG cell wall anchor domain-containing protein n=1 Tax=Isoptericola sp. NPDC019482 TaxID=3154688 RepID=UPI0034795812